MTNTMRYLLALLVLSGLLLRHAPAAACNPCDGWWTIDHAWSMCAEGQPLFGAKVSCISSACAMPCASWLSSYDACVAGADPTCQIDVTEGCNDCMISSCHAELVACGDDCTGATTCDGWLAGGDPQALCGRPSGASSLDGMLALSDCACWGTGACVDACAMAACVAPGLLDPLALTPGDPLVDACITCLQDTGAGCGNELNGCFSN